MKKILFLIIAVVVNIQSCGLLNQADSSYVQWFIDNAEPVAVNVSSDYFISSMNFTGDLEADFGPTRVLINDPEKDAKSANGTATRQYHDITKVYVAYDFFNLYIGLQSPELPEDYGQPGDMKGAAYIYINNGMTPADSWNTYTNGVYVVNSTGLADLGITGTIGSFEETGIRVTNGASVSGNEKLISAFIKHFRPNKNVHMYNFASGASVHSFWTPAVASESWPTYFEDYITEIGIPLRTIFGPNITNLPTFYIAIRKDDALTADSLGLLSDANATAVDWAPSQGSGTNAYGTFLTNWFEVSGF